MTCRFPYSFESLAIYGSVNRGKEGLSDMMSVMGVAVLSLAVRVGTPAEACAQSLTRFKAAQNLLISTIESYEQCVRSNDPSNDCAAEYQALRSSQSDFANVVADFGKRCRK